MQNELGRYLASLSDEQLAQCIRDTQPRSAGNMRPKMRAKLRAIHRATVIEIGGRVGHA